jgi:two-component system LytT family sensor kinase
LTISVRDVQAIDSMDKRQALSKGWLVLGSWVLVVLLFATQWYTYDSTRGSASPYLYYLGWSCFMWALSPLVLWFAGRHPIEARAWKRSIALHAATSIALGILQVLIEGSIGWLRLRHDLSFQAILAHYSAQHLQFYVLTYWALVVGAQFYRIHNEAHHRELRAAQLEMQLSAARLDALRGQLQPHFLFNTLHAAVSLVHDDPDGAEDILLRLSQLLRASLAEFHTHEVPLRKEMEFLDSYVGIQKRRFGERLRVVFHIDQRVLDFAVPSLVLQPLLENAIRHGIGTHKEDDVVTVNAFQDDGHLMLEVCNRNSTLTDEPERLLARGVGLANTRARLGQLYGEGHTLQLLNLEPRGVCVRLALPLRQVSGATAARSA